MTHPGLTKIGSIALADVEVLSVYAGRSFLPFPFLLSDPEPYASDAEYEAYSASVLDRFWYGDLNAFLPWVRTYHGADLHVECRVMYADPDAPPARVIAHRKDQAGFFARQAADQFIEVFAVSPYELGSAVASAAKLTRPGKHREIELPEVLVPRIWRVRKESEPVEHDDDAVTFRAPAAQSRPPDVPLAELATTATVQSHWRPVRKWGFDHGKNAVVWATVRDGGDYVCAPGTRRAKPMTQADLGRRIDELIAEDVAALRAARAL